MEEIWKDIEGFEGLYQVSNLGRVKSLERYVYHGDKAMLRKERIRRPYDNQGYWNLTINKDGKEYHTTIHQLVAKAFVPNPDNKPVVNHIDGDKKNNRADNLEWVTVAENARHAIKMGLISAEQCRINGRKSIDATAIRVKCEDTGQLFESIIAVKRYTKSDAIQENLHDHKRTHNGRGWLFTIVNEEYYQAHKDDVIDEEACEKIHAEIRKRIKSQGKAVKIYCVERDIHYPSRSAAARDNNMNVETINLAIKENRKAKGLTFKIEE